MRYMVYKVALGHVCLRVLRFSPVCIIPSMLHLHLHVACNLRTNGQSLRTFHKRCWFVNRGALNRKALPLLFSLYRFSSASVIQAVLHIQSYLHATLSRRTNGAKPGRLEKAVICRKSGCI
jgi:hypothetical protein